ncbi:hypothetical protein [Pseudopedobacter beijingensis]|uniref:Collagen triple helix repeat-containing protein n=1 Tax=Pseudopedobacter beijingensis TaxID=1207056 RepID=A0ABW4IHU6_9SPHI
MKRNYNLKIKKSIFAALLAVLTLNACQKEASEGPQGEKGEQGIAGADGSTLLSGNGEPTVSLGKTGDYYLDKTAVTIYGPKTSAGWGEATSLKGGTDGKDGANGTNGKDGSKILSGTDVPALSLGAEGDFYFDTQNVAIYGPKTSTGWGNPVSLKAQANGVTVLLYKNHAFQSVVRNEYGNFEVESIIPIDAKYHEVCENGMVIAQVRKSDDANAGWGNGLYYEYSTDNSLYLYYDISIDDFNKIKNQIKVSGSFYQNISESEVKAFKIDIKIILIPATTVEVMSSKKINTKDLKAVSKYLGL